MLHQVKTPESRIDIQLDYRCPVAGFSLSGALLLHDEGYRIACERVARS